VELCSQSDCFIPAALVTLVLGISSPFLIFGNGSLEFACVEPVDELPDVDEVAVEVSEELVEVELVVEAVLVSELVEVEVVAVLVSELLGEVELVVEAEGLGFTKVYAHSCPDSPYPVHRLQR